MNLDMLNKLSTDGLLSLKENVETVLKARLDTTLRIGRIVTFEAQGALRTMTIERINGKSVSGRETGGSFRPGSKWRVSKNVLTVIPEVKAAPVMPLKTPHKPTTFAGDAW